MLTNGQWPQALEIKDLRFRPPKEAPFKQHLTQSRASEMSRSFELPRSHLREAHNLGRQHKDDTHSPSTIAVGLPMIANHN
eukprot:scaffold28772_cov23-Prasinocladus_malaysianus.AAC.1